MRLTVLLGPFLPTPPGPGGAVEQRWYHKARTWASWGHDVTMVSREWEGLAPSETDDAGLKHVRVPSFADSGSNKKNLLLDLRYTLRAMKRLPDADVVVTNTFWAPVVLPRLRKRAGKVAVNIARFPKGQFKLYAKAGRLIAVSSAIADAVADQAPQVLPILNWIVNPVNAHIFTPPEGERPRSGERIIAYTGRVHPEKGLDLLLDAFARVHASHPDVKLRIFGPHAVERGGGGDAFLEELKARAPGAPVEFMGPIYEREVLAGHLREASVYCYPSRAYLGEACPVAPLESMAVGLPPVVTDLPQFRDYVRHGENGFIFERDAPDAVDQLVGHLTTLLDDHERSRAMGVVAREQAERHSLEHIAQRYLDEFDRMLKGEATGFEPRPVQTSIA